MKNKIYNKLVRDKIPEIIKQAGLDCETDLLSDRQHFEALIKKLDEEIRELKSVDNDDQWLEELADIYEVILALIKTKGFTFSQLEETRQKKYLDRGGFERGICLKSVTRTPMNYDD